jgi:anti-sigma regulatory factor (Ser/Thr protein kinase)
MMEDLSFHVLDLAENAIAAGASRVTILVNENVARDLLTIRVSDNGRGIPADVRERVFDPFFTTKSKRTGLGLPLLAQAARQSGGGVEVVTAPGRGTRVTARFRYGHIDRQPLTGMAETIMMLALGNPEVDFRYRHRRNGRTFKFSSRRVLAGTGRRAPVHPALIRSVRKTLQNGLRRIGTT